MNTIPLHTFIKSILTHFPDAIITIFLCEKESDFNNKVLSYFSRPLDSSSNMIGT